MNVEELIQQCAHRRAGFAAIELRKQIAMSKPAEDRSRMEQCLVDMQSKTIEENLTEAQKQYRDRISPDELAACLGMYRKSVKGLPLKTTTPYERTPHGFRQMLRYSRSDVLAFLTDLNPAYADYDFRPLLSTKEATEVFEHCGVEVMPHTLAQLRKDDVGPNFVALNSRVIRYRLSDVLDWIECPTAGPDPSNMIAGELL